MYNLEYYEKMLRNNSATAQSINAIRWNFVKEINPQTVLDYGSGVGWFRAFRPENVTVHTFDIGEFPQTGVLNARYDLITLWDVLEHLPNFEALERLFKAANYIALTVPVWHSGIELKTWKHLKPKEHLKIFTHESLIELLAAMNFTLIKHGTPECPPREDIGSYLFRNRLCEN